MFLREYDAVARGLRTRNQKRTIRQYKIWPVWCYMGIPDALKENLRGRWQVGGRRRICSGLQQNLSEDVNLQFSKSALASMAQITNIGKSHQFLFVPLFLRYSTRCCHGFEWW